ncbi:MAG: hypothetical protein ACO1QR_13430 [Chthoniobacteraceae bacterium]
MAEEFYGYEAEPERQGKDNLFLWTVFILLLIGVAFACWLGSFYVFGHPEEPRAYKILKKLGKIDAPRRFEVTAAPLGEFLSAQKLYQRYSGMTRLELERENDELLRNYIKNYRETKKRVPYLTGVYQIIAATELKPTDMFTSGMVAVAQSTDFPQVLIEHLYPASPATVSSLSDKLQTGLDLKLERTHDLSAVIHAERTFDGRMQFTVVPLLYGRYALKNGVGTFGLEPPADLNVSAGVPVIKGPQLQEALRTYAEFRKSRPLQNPAALEGEDGPKGPELVRLDAERPGTAVPETGALPDVPVATPVPVNPPAVASNKPPIRATPRPRATPGELALNTTPRPVATPVMERPATPAAERPATPRPSTPAVSPQGVPLNPFIASAPAPTMQTSSSSWRTYAPGRAPAGRSVTPAEASVLADRGDLGERLYLRGNFVVTASGENRAVLRAQGAVGDPAKPGTGAARIIVEYPSSALPPNEGASFARDESRGFEVRDVRRGADGQINIYVREVTLPE